MTPRLPLADAEAIAATATRLESGAPPCQRITAPTVRTLTRSASRTATSAAAHPGGLLAAGVPNTVWKMSSATTHSLTKFERLRRTLSGG